MEGKYDLMNVGAEYILSANETVTEGDNIIFRATSIRIDSCCCFPYMSEAQSIMSCISERGYRM
jgi:hypothetical protein